MPVCVEVEIKKSEREIELEIILGGKFPNIVMDNLIGGNMLGIEIKLHSPVEINGKGIEIKTLGSKLPSLGIMIAINKFKLINI